MGTKKRPTAAEAAATANARAYDNVNNTLKKALGGKQRPWMTGELSTSAERLTSVRKPKAPAQPSTNVPTPLATESNEPQPKLPNAASTIATEPSNQPGTLQNPLPEAEGSAIQSNTVATTGTRNQPLDPRPDETTIRRTFLW
ncbi:hypothetical protein BZA77DRAFT_363209 [Pyronema omphalodes]|nr:hypothetical protein BZA77DRAFT_363209 [Pyronema omphalodes]